MTSEQGAALYPEAKEETKQRQSCENRTPRPIEKKKKKKMKLRESMADSLDDFLKKCFFFPAGELLPEISQLLRKTN